MKRKPLMNTFAAACTSKLPFAAAAGAAGPNTTNEVIAKYTAEPIKLDGKFDEKSWATAPAYSLMQPLKSFSGLPESMQKTSEIWR